jgi:hypothetical protein
LLHGKLAQRGIGSLVAPCIWTHPIPISEEGETGKANCVGTHTPSGTLRVRQQLQELTQPSLLVAP